MPRRKRSKSQLSADRGSDQTSVSSGQIVRVPKNPPVRPNRRLLEQPEVHVGPRRFNGTPHIVVRDQGQTCEEIAFAELENGTIVDVIRHPSDPRRIQLAAWSNNRVRFRDRLRSGDRILVPPRRHDHIIGNLVLPTGVAPYKSVSALAREIRQAIRTCVSVLNPYPSLIAAWCVYTWVADLMPMAVHLCISGLAESGKTTLLELLRLFCRRSLLTAETTAAGFYEACSLVSPTLMLDEADLDKRSSSQIIRRLLRAATNRNHPVLRQGASWDAFGPKVICGENPPDDPALLSRCLIVPMVERDTSTLKKPHDLEIVALSRKLQNQLLCFRFEKYHTISPIRVAGAERLHARRRDLLTTVAAPFANDPEWVDLILQCLENTSQVSRPMLIPPEAAVLDGLYAICHREGLRQLVMMAHFVHFTSDLYRAAGQPFRLDLVSVGKILTKFGIRSRVHTSSGNGFWINETNNLRVHELAEKYGLTLPTGLLVGSSPYRCPNCERAENNSAMFSDEEDSEESESSPMHPGAKTPKKKG